jgi:hypothetical protein
LFGIQKNGAPSSAAFRGSVFIITIMNLSATALPPGCLAFAAPPDIWPNYMTKTLFGRDPSAESPAAAPRIERRRLVRSNARDL